MQRNLWSNTVLTKGKKGNYKIEGKHPSPQINKKTKWKSSSRVVFYMFLVLTIWPVACSSLLPYIWVCNFIWIPHRGKKERKRCSFHKKSCFFWLSTKKRCAIRIAQRKRIYNQNKRHHPSLEGNNSFERCSWTCLQLVFGILVWLCTSVTISFSLCGCSLSFWDSFFLCDFVLQTALANDGQRVGFGVKNPVLQWEKVIVRKQQVQIPAQTKDSPFSSNWKCTVSTHNVLWYPIYTKAPH